MRSNLLEKIPLVLFLILLVVFSVSIFKNIAYPLLWQDEAETAIGATRVLTYGYPKSNDGKNTLNLLELDDKSLAIKEPYDAYITSSWSQFYVAAIGVKLSSFVSDIYTKTALIRIPFALIGLVGILLCAQVAKNIFGGRSQWLFYSGYVFLCMLSISLTLHIREVRYYSLTILLSGATLWLYTVFRHNQSTLSRRNFVTYTLVLVTLLITTLATFPPLFFILILTLGIAEVWHLFFKTHNKPLTIKDHLLHTLPLALTLILSIPVFLFFEILPLANALSEFMGFNAQLYWFNLNRTISFLFTYEFLGLFIVGKLAAGVTNHYRNNRDHALRLSHFLTLYLTVYILFIARTPYLFERYLMALIPILNLVIVIDFFTVTRAIQHMTSKKLQSDILFVSIPLFIVMFAISLIPKLPHISGHLYELTHQYKGPVDYAVEYINDTFPDPSQLVIATNYEELSYEFYLGSKVTIGYVGNNLLEDSTIQPDIIIMRKNRDNFVDTFKMLLSKDSYTGVNFEIDDYDFNNIPELYLAKPHRYQTTFAKDDNNKLSIYVRTAILPNPVSR